MDVNIHACIRNEFGDIRKKRWIAIIHVVCIPCVLSSLQNQGHADAKYW